MLGTARNISFVVILLGSIAIAGCDAFKALAVLSEVKEKRKAEYAGLPGKMVAVVVWVPYEVSFEYPYASFEIATFVQRALDFGLNNNTKKQPRTRFVEQNQIRTYQENNLDWDQELPETLGAQFGCDVILDIQVSEFGTRQPDTPDIYRGRLRAAVTLWDVSKPDSSRELWRKDIFAAYPENNRLGLTDANDTRVRQETLDMFADRLAKNFYEYEEVVK